MRAVRSAAGLMSIALLACQGATSDPGLELPLRIQGAQLALGPLPAANGGPEVTFLAVPQNRVRAGESQVPMAGRTGPTGYAVLIGLQGANEHWIVPVGLPDSVAIEELNWSARLDFSPALAPGATMVEIAAVDGEGRAGESTTAQFMLTGDAPEGALVVTLEWDRNVDLDLHVVLPDGTDLGPKNINSYEPPAPGRPPPPPDAWMEGARIDFDSNAACLIDGRRRERATWTMSPPPGLYLIFVDLAAACGEPVVNFRVTIHRDGMETGTTGGTLYEFDSRRHPAPPGNAAGLLVRELEVQ